MLPRGPVNRRNFLVGGTAGAGLTVLGYALGSQRQAPEGRAGTVTVAAANSAATSKTQADFVCPGANDEATLQKAIDALPATGGKVVLFEGDYRLSAPIVIGKSLVLQGMGAGYDTEWSRSLTALRLAPGVASNLVQVQSQEGGQLHVVYFRDLYFVGNVGSHQGPSSGLVVDGNVDGVWLFSCSFSHFSDSGITLRGVVDVWVTDTTIEECGGPALFLDSRPPHHARLVWVTNCFLGSSAEGLRAEGKGGYDLVVSGGTVIGNRQNGVVLQSLQRNAAIMGVTFRSNGTQEGEWSDLYVADCQGVVVSNNLMYDPGNPLSCCYGVRIVDCRQSTIEGNVMRYHGRSGIRLEGSSQIIATGNNLSDNCLSEHDAFGEIELRATQEPCRNNVLTGNNISQQAEKRARHGIWADHPGCDGNVVTGNIVIGAVREGIRAGGGRSEVGHNVSM